jgi:hypothetical protein
MKTKIVAVAKNEEKYLEEWLKYHFSLGFDNITIYDNSGNGELKSNDKLTVYDAPGDRIQLQAYQNELVNARYNEWILFIDIDEFLNIGNLSVQDFLKPYLGVDVVKLNWVCHNDNDKLVYEDSPVRERFIRPARLDCVYNDSVRVPENCHTKAFYCHKHKQTRPDIHTIHIDGGIAINTEGKQVNIDSPFQDLCLKRGFIDHYICKSTTEWCERRLNTKDACGNVVADFDTLKRWYFNLNTYSKEKENIIESYRLDKDLGEIPNKCDREPLQPVGESEGPEPDSKQVNRSHKRVRGGK